MNKLAAVLAAAAVLGAVSPASAQVSFSGEKLAALVAGVSAQAGLAPAPAPAPVSSAPAAAPAQKGRPTQKFAVLTDDPAVSAKFKKLWRERSGVVRHGKARSFGRF